MKKVLKIAFLGITLMAAQATRGEGFYLGAALGAAMPEGSYKALNPLANDKHFATAGGTSALIGGLWGVDYFLCDCAYLAFEVNALYNSYHKLIRSSSNTAGIANHVVKLKNHFQYGGILKFGTEVCGVIPYVLFGLEAGRWNLNLSNDSNIANRGIPGNSSRNFAKTLTGPRVGFGIRFTLLPCLKADMQYAYSFFGKVSATLVDSITGVSWSHSAKIRQNAVLLSLNYVF